MMENKSTRTLRFRDPARAWGPVTSLGDLRVFYLQGGRSRYEFNLYRRALVGSGNWHPVSPFKSLFPLIEKIGGGVAPNRDSGQKGRILFDLFARSNQNSEIPGIRDDPEAGDRMEDRSQSFYFKGQAIERKGVCSNENRAGETGYLVDGERQAERGIVDCRAFK
jgi:hypothetical protein